MTHPSTDRNAQADGFAAFALAYFARCRQALEQNFAVAIPEKRFSQTWQWCHEVCRRADSAAPSLVLSMSALYRACVSVSNSLVDTVALSWENRYMDQIVIFDGKGYWCGMRRPSKDRIVHFWSTKKKDATRIYFAEVAQKIAATIPQRVTLLSL